MIPVSRKSAMQRTYAHWAGVYDALYAGLLRPGQLSAIASAMKAGARVLEIGVGTGLSLGYYPPQAEVYGIDLSPDMLAKAAAKVAEQQLSHVRGLSIMDACHLGFSDGTFDAGIALYVITLVPNPEAALNELARVVRPGGIILVASHLGAEQGLVARAEHSLAPVMRRIGWSSDFKLSRLMAWAEATGLARFDGVDSMAPGGFFKVARFVRR